MNINNNPYDSLNTPALDVVRKLQENSALTAVHELQASSAVTTALKMETTGVFAAVRELQSTLNAVKSSMGGATAALEEYRRIVAPISESIKAMNLAYAPIFEQTRAFDTLNIKGIISGLQTSTSAMSAISGLNLSGVASIIDALPKYDFLSDMVTDDFSVDVAEKLYESGEITQDDINEEITEIVGKKQFSPKAEWDKIKKSKWFIAIKILIIIATFVCNPVTEYVTDKALDSLGITEFWEESGVYDLIDLIFGDTEESIVSEAEAKATVDESKTGNISKQKREDLLDKIKEIRNFIAAAPQDENTGNLLSYLTELERDVNGKKYGLVFEEHLEEIDEVLDTHTPVLSEEKDLFIDNGGQMNFLIEGDNLASLKLLEKTHKGKIDLIYIDPPYNTKNKDFIYDDSFVDNNDNYRHSKWVSFLIQRLKIAHSLLTKNGVIFISIDDNEQASLRLIADSIFGDNNFIAEMVWQKKKGGSNDSRHVATEHEYILMYSKNKDLLGNIFIAYGDEYISRYKEEDEKGRYFWDTFKRKSGKQYYAITCPDGTILEKEENGEPISWLRSEPRFHSDLAEGEARIVKINGKWTVHFKQRQPKGYKPRSIITEYGTTSEGASELKGIFNVTNIFSNPKPVKLIEYLIKFISRKDLNILDFFAGSGTTGHAVMKLNSEDGGNRKFILCTNNENNICRDVTYERIKRVIDKKGYSASLKYYKVDYVPISDRLYYEYADELLKHIRELVELENAINFTGNTKIAIVLTEEEFDNIVAKADDFARCKKLYMGHDLLPTEEQEKIIKSYGIEISIIPDYYYRDLQEG